MAKRKMLAKIKYDYKKRSKDIVAELEIDLSRFERQFSKAQWELDSMIMTDMQPFMPQQTGTFINVTRLMSAAIAGTGKVYAAAPPFGRYLYEGKVMVDSETGRGPFKIPNGPGEYILRFRKGAELKATDRPLQYSKAAHPGVTDHWFEAAKKAYGKQWAEKAKRIAGGG